MPATWRCSTARSSGGRAILALEADALDDLDSVSDGHYYRLGPEARTVLAEVDLVMMRKDPPFDMEYVYATYLLERARDAGAVVVNDPTSLRDCNEKFYATRFTDVTPPLIVATRGDLLLDFHAEHGDVVFKKLDGMGGKSIFRVRRDDPNLRVIIETLTVDGDSPVMAQKFIPEIEAGDKRILLIDGEPVPYALARIPKAGESRGNLAAGGEGVGQPLSERDAFIAAHVGPGIASPGTALRRHRCDRRLPDRDQRHLSDVHSGARPAIRPGHRRGSP